MSFPAGFYAAFLVPASAALWFGLSARPIFAWTASVVFGCGGLALIAAAFLGGGGAGGVFGLILGCLALGLSAAFALAPRLAGWASPLLIAPLLACLPVLLVEAILRLPF